ncbi:ribonucleoside-diphosphate reductase subunit alpha [Candidatus Kinetoplastidibacterium galati]|uniref:Ribonucleoside-diphosphate reductase n=1 Tax=Candidatus Kinetoplastidibacterium galati TCC219 TaxID=1208921 RepID=M1LUU4_9PROT|nr:ribonucleoside-diphosphate reductase subunit alpha [Candidatus Kinetoplastibacterium galatii]AGF49312.1 ribonucleoside-diphosphate reductase alpha chain [Candidatus Kinetoplastibacterium galatii TCC219]
MQKTVISITDDSSAVSKKQQNNIDKLSDYKVIRRNGSVVDFIPSKINVAITKAFIAVRNEQGIISSSTRELIEKLTDQVIYALVRNKPDGGSFHIEDIQDHVELSLMRSGLQDVARAYVLYREKRNRERVLSKTIIDKKNENEDESSIRVKENNQLTTIKISSLKSIIKSSISGLENTISEEDINTIIKETLKNLYDGIPVKEVFKSIILTTRAKIEKEPSYNYVTARILLHTIRREVLGRETSHEEMYKNYSEYFTKFIKLGVKGGILSSDLENYDLDLLGNAIDASRDLNFKYLGLQTLYDRYFLHLDGKRIELPQIFFMRVAMGIAIREQDKNQKAIEFYNVLSSFDFMSSTPTLFNSGTKHAQMSSCYLTTVPDNLEGIYESIKENALLAKYAGGLGNDWTPVRALRSHIKGTNGESQGVVPFLKVVNDTAVAVNQGGKRKGAVCTYLETWHLDIEEFLELRKNTGDERRRTHDMNTSNWIPDLFMKRVMENKDWTLFSPSDCPDLHEKYGKDFEQAYNKYETKTINGEIKLFKKIPAVSLWRKMLSMLFETGHPWITFKDTCNVRSPQQHIGVIHSSNLCTEITLNTNETEIAVCNLGSINLNNHMKISNSNSFELDLKKLQKTTTIAMRMLDNIIDINYYAVLKAKQSNEKHRPVGLGIMGFQDCLHMMRISYASNEAIDFADKSMEAICYYSYLASSNLAKERGKYSSFKGSLWSHGILPQDTIKMLEKERGGYIEMDQSSQLDWEYLRNHILEHGMRNSNCVAIAPTATISNIIGVSASIEPTFQNLYVKSNLSGEFTIINEFLVNDLKKLNIWDEVMVSDIKYFDGSLSRIDRIPQNIRDLYKTAFEIQPEWLVECASRRQKWIDQAQSLNIYMAGASGKKLDETYKLAWTRGLKTTYYLRAMGATSTEKSTGQGGELNSVIINEDRSRTCQINISSDQECEVCQ